MCFGSPRLVWRTFADHGLATDERRAVRDLAPVRYRALDRGEVVAVDATRHVPAVGLEPPDRVVGEPSFRLAIDRDAVVVVEHHELAQAQRAGERARFVRNALHQTSVTDKGIGTMVDDRVAGSIELCSEQPFRERHPDRVGQSLPQRTGRRFDARRRAEFGVAGRFRMQLAKALQFFDRQVVAGQMQQRVEKHRTVPVRDDEAIPVHPFRIRGVVGQMPGPEGDGDFGHAHRHARVAAFRGLDSIHGERADRIRELGNGGVRGRGHDGGSFLRGMRPE